MSERDAVLFANEAFYRAFADRDFALMETLWAVDPVACIHPGWPALIGRGTVMESWRRILAGPQAPAIVCRRPEAYILGDSAYVICYEDVEGSILAATHLFRRDGRRWLLVHHQAGPSPNLPVGGEEPKAEIPN